MCIAILQLTGTAPIDQHKWNICAANNGDGIGFAFSEANRIHIVKDVNNSRELYKAYTDAVKKYGDTSNFMLHFRKATSGLVNARNAHPYYINKDIVFCHNGVLGGYSEANNLVSDTLLFCEDILKDIGERVWREEIRLELETSIGNYNKLVFLNSNNDYCIANEAQGSWEHGHWYSNNSHKYWQGYSNRALYDYGACFSEFSHNKVIQTSTWKKGDMCPECNMSPLITAVELEYGICNYCTRVNTY